MPGLENGRGLARRWLRTTLHSLLSCAAIALSPAPGWSESAPDANSASWRDWTAATGDWGGLRPRAEEAGIGFFARYSTGFFANVKGGFDTGIRYDGLAEWGFGLDLQRLANWRGADFRMNWYSYHGGQPSEELVGVYPTQVVNAYESQGRIRFYEIVLSQQFLDDRVRVEIGQLAADREFFQSESSALLLNGSFGFLGVARSIMPFYPTAAPGVFVATRTYSGGLELRFGAYTGDVGEDEPSNIGFDWAFGDGVSFLGEVLLRPRILNRRGTLALGAAGTTADLRDSTSVSPQPSDASWALYGTLDWPLLISESGESQAALFFRGFGSPESVRAPIHWYASFGLSAKNPWFGRGRDSFGFGFNWQKYSDAYVAGQEASGNSVSDFESIIEVTYRARVLGWMSLQPDLQIVLDPHYSRRNAVVIALRAVIDL